MARFGLTVSLFILVAFFQLPSSFCQLLDIGPDTAVSVPGAGHDYVQMLSETVDPSSGATSVRIAVPVPPGRALTLPFSFDYDSNGLFYVSGSKPSYQATTGYLFSGGWSYSVPIMGYKFGKTQHTNHLGQIWWCQWASNYSFRDPSGGRHSLGLYWNPINQGQGNKGGCGSSVTSAAGVSLQSNIVDGFPANQPALIASADGTTYSFVGSPAELGGTPETNNFVASLVEDRNGNQVGITDLGSGSFSVTDSAGRPALSSSGFGVSGNTVTVSGLGASYVITWGSVSYNWNPGWTLISGTGCYSAPAPQGSMTVITAIQLPNGKKYLFSYDPTYGLVSKVTYPSGGWVSYMT